MGADRAEQTIHRLRLIRSRCCRHIKPKLSLGNHFAGVRVHRGLWRPEDNLRCHSSSGTGCCHNGFWRQGLSLTQGSLTRLGWLDYPPCHWDYKSTPLHFVLFCFVLWGMGSSSPAWPTLLLAELSAPVSQSKARTVNKGEVCDWCYWFSLTAARRICVGISFT